MQKKIFSLLVLLMTAVSGAWAQEETLLTTIENTGDNADFISGSKTFDNIATVSFSGEVNNDNDEWGWYPEDGERTLTVTAAEGYTITRVKFYTDSSSAFDEEAPFEAILVSSFTEFYTKVNGTSIGQIGVTKIEVYGYAGTPAPVATTNYYLVGTMNDWGASKQFLLTPNPGNAAEYMITLNLKAGTELKVIGVEEGKETVWYPSGDNYVVNDAGQYTVYFRPDGQGGEGWHYGCIYLAPAPAPAVPLTDLGSGQWQFEMPDYAVVAKIEYDTELELQEENVNTAVLADWHGYEADITLKRKLVAGSWNTLAVPFNVSSTMLDHLTTTYGMSVKQLASTSLENEGKTLMLNFENATEMVAGTPYLVKVSTDYDFSARALPNVEVSQELNPVQTDYADFIPTLGKTLVTGPEGDKSNTDAVLFLATGNTLKNPTVVNDTEQESSYMKGFRAYFQLKNVPAEARSFALNLGDESTGIESLTTSPMAEGSTYDLQGRKANAAQKGVYIVNGKKVIK